jgi:hypothetical protein
MRIPVTAGGESAMPAVCCFKDSASQSSERACAADRRSPSIRTYAPFTSAGGATQLRERLVCAAGNVPAPDSASRTHNASDLIGAWRDRRRKNIVPGQRTPLPPWKCTRPVQGTDIRISYCSKRDPHRSPRVGLLIRVSNSRHGRCQAGNAAPNHVARRRISYLSPSHGDMRIDTIQRLSVLGDFVFAQQQCVPEETERRIRARARRQWRTDVGVYRITTWFV